MNKFTDEQRLEIDAMIQRHAEAHGIKLANHAHRRIFAQAVAEGQPMHMTDMAAPDLRAFYRAVAFSGKIMREEWGV